MSMGVAGGSAQPGDHPARCCCDPQRSLSCCEAGVAGLASYAAILGLNVPIHKMGIVISILNGSHLNSMHLETSRNGCYLEMTLHHIILLFSEFFYSKMIKDK